MYHSSLKHKVELFPGMPISYSLDANYNFNINTNIFDCSTVIGLPS